MREMLRTTEKGGRNNRKRFNKATLKNDEETESDTRNNYER
jgi:hypothetical protein